MVDNRKVTAACSHGERRESLFKQAAFNVSGDSSELNDRQMLPPGVVADHEFDLLTGLTVDRRCRRIASRVGQREDGDGLDEATHTGSERGRRTGRAVNSITRVRLTS